MKKTLLTTLIAATLALTSTAALAAVPKDMLVIGKAADPQNEPVRYQAVSTVLVMTTS